MPEGRMRRRRRDLVRDGVLAAFGVGVGAVGFAEAADVTDRKLPLRGGAAAAVMPDRPDLHGDGRLQVTWSVSTEEKLVALTFDDGPAPRWTPMVLDILHQHRVPATFFMVGERARRHADIIRNRMTHHDVGNHTWTHRDLARTDADEAHEELLRTHITLTDLTGGEPRLLRPPYGHLSGGALAAAARMRYDIVLWSQQMNERRFSGDPAGHARHIIDRAQPGGILLAHDTGPEHRLVALNGLPHMITELRARGFQFVTVSTLLAMRR